MAEMNVTIPHRLTEAEALRRVKSLLQEVKQQYGNQVSDMHEQWNGSTGTFRFNTMGSTVSGSLTVTPGEVRLNGTLPFAASFFKGTIEKMIRERAEKLLA